MAKVVVWGLGAMGTMIARLLLEKPWAELCGAVARNPEVSGKDIGEHLGLSPAGACIYTDPGELFERVKPDVAVICTSAFLEDVAPQVEECLRAGANAITIAEEMAYPWARNPGMATRIHELARGRGATVLGTGINPGFVLDTLVITLTGACSRVDRIEAKRVNDLAPFGPAVMRTQGIGLTPEEFEEGVKRGYVVGHVGFAESVGLVAAAVGWKVERVEETRRPIVSRVERETAYARVEPGKVAGCDHTARAFAGGREVIVLRHPQQVRPEAEGVATGDYITIQGEPDINLSVVPEIPGGIGTASIAVNMIPAVLNAPPGLATMADLPVPRCIMSDVDLLKGRCTGGLQG